MLQKKYIYYHKFTYAKHIISPLKKKLSEYRRIITGIIYLLTGFSFFIITFPYAILIGSFFSSLVHVFILFNLIGINLMGLGLCYILEKKKDTIDKIQRLVQLQEALKTDIYRYKKKITKRIFTKAFPYICDNCKMFSYDFLENCEHCGAKNTTRKVLKKDYKTFLKIKP
ncbi:MAG: hypothetical protein ACFFAA_14165 [Promethearchaeota archaeon]